MRAVMPPKRKLRASASFAGRKGIPETGISNSAPRSESIDLSSFTTCISPPLSSTLSTPMSVASVHLEDASPISPPLSSTMSTPMSVASVHLVDASITSPGFDVSKMCCLASHGLDMSSSVRNLDDTFASTSPSPSPAPRLGERKEEVAHDLRAVQLCSSLLSLMEEVAQLAQGRYSVQKPGADIFEVTRDATNGRLQVARVRETVKGLEDAEQIARKGVAIEIEQRNKDIATLRQEIGALSAKIQEGDEEGSEELAARIGQLNLNIGKHKKRIRELERTMKVEVKVEVERVSTCLDMVTRSHNSVDKQARMVPMRDPGIYVLGGGTSGTDVRSASSVVEWYNVKKDSWIQMAEMRTKRWGASSVALKGYLYALGGFDGQANLSSVERFDTRKEKWEEVAPMDTPRSGGAAAVMNGFVYVAGGIGKEGHHHKSVARYDPVSNSWTEVAEMSCARSLAASVAADSQFYVIGGGDGTNTWRTMERYDPIRNSWELLPPMTCKRRGCAAAVLNGQIYVIGGSTTNLPSVERFDIRNNTWEMVAPMNCKRHGCSAVVLDGLLYAIGGFNGSEALDTVERYDATSNSWELVAPLQSKRDQSCAVVV